MKLSDIHKKYYSHLPEETFWQLVKADPTYDGEKHPQKRGRFTSWIMSLYQSNQLSLDYIDTCHQYLSVFNRYQTLMEERDIMKYTSLEELYDAVKFYMDYPDELNSKQAKIRRIKEGAERVYEDDEWLVIVPRTWQAACYYGKGTRWCTASKVTDKLFHHYDKDGSLFININKSNRTKYQFHFATNTYADEADNSIAFEEVKLSDGLRKYYDSVRDKPIQYVTSFSSAIQNIHWNEFDSRTVFHRCYFDTTNDRLEREALSLLRFPSTVTSLRSLFTDTRLHGAGNDDERLNLDDWNTEHIKDMSCMFSYHAELEELSLARWNVSNVHDMSNMFAYCLRMRVLVLDEWRLSDNVQCDGMFTGLWDMTDLSLGGCNYSTYRHLMYEVLREGLFIADNGRMLRFIRIIFDNEFKDVYDRFWYNCSKFCEGAYQELNAMDVDAVESHVESVIKTFQNMIWDKHTIFLNKNPEVMASECFSKQFDTLYDNVTKYVDRQFYTKKETYEVKKFGPLLFSRLDYEAQYFNDEAKNAEREKCITILETFSKIAAHYDEERRNLLLDKIGHYKSIEPLEQRLTTPTPWERRWHVAIPAVMRFVDSLKSEETIRKGAENLRHEKPSRLQQCCGLIVLALLVAMTVALPVMLLIFAVMIPGGLLVRYVDKMADNQHGIKKIGLLILEIIMILGLMALMGYIYSLVE